jgi:hypothetical protein
MTGFTQTVRASRPLLVAPGGGDILSLASVAGPRGSSHGEPRG